MSADPSEHVHEWGPDHRCIRCGRPAGWRCLCEGEHEEGCPWGEFLAAPLNQVDRAEPDDRKGPA